MNPGQPQTVSVIEARVAACLQAGAYPQAAAAALEGFGRDVERFLLRRCRYDRSVAEEAWERFLLDLCEGIPRFRGESLCRTWCFTLARNALCRTYRERARLRRMVLLPEEPVVPVSPALLAETQPWWTKDTAKLALAEAIRELPAEDQRLLALKDLEGKDWREIAQLLSPGEVPLSGSELRREVDRLKQRYCRRIRRVLRERLVGSPPEPHREEARL